MSKAITLTGPAKAGTTKLAGPAKAGTTKLMPEFNTARKHIANVRDAGRKMQHEMILLGIELNRLKTTVGAKHGGDRKSSLHGANLIAWDELVFDQTGLSYETCHRWMTIAKGAQKAIPLLTAPDVLKKPFSALPEKRQEEVVKVLSKAVDGQTMAEMSVSFGVCKAPKLNHPPKATKKSARTRSDNADDETLTAAQLMEQALHDKQALHDMHLGEAWKALDADDLADMENILTAYQAAVSKELKKRGGKA